MFSFISFSTARSKKKKIFFLNSFSPLPLYLVPIFLSWGSKALLPNALLQEKLSSRLPPLAFRTQESLAIGAVTIRAMIGHYKSLGWGRLGCYDMLASLSVLLPRQHAPYNGSYNNTSFDWVLWISLGVDSVATMTCNIRNWCFVTSSWLIYDLQLGLFGVGGDWFSSGELLDLGIWFKPWLLLFFFFFFWETCHGCLIHEGLDGSRVTTRPSITYWYCDNWR